MGVVCVHVCSVFMFVCVHVHACVCVCVRVHVHACVHAWCMWKPSLVYAVLVHYNMTLYMCAFKCMYPTTVHVVFIWWVEALCPGERHSWLVWTIAYTCVCLCACMCVYAAPVYVICVHMYAWHQYVIHPSGKFKHYDLIWRTSIF